MSEILPEMYIGLHVRYSLFLSDVNKTCIFSKDFLKKNSNRKFHENPSSGSRNVPLGWGDGRKDKHNKVKSRFTQFFERA